jgi:predicted acyltransferase (DUF342 family)
MASVVFYSNYCPHSKKFIDILKRSGESSNVSSFICVDKNEKGQRPLEVKKYTILEVPSVISNAKILPGISAFEWLANKIESNRVPIKDNNSSKNNNTLSGIQSHGLLNNTSCVELGENTSIFGEAKLNPFSVGEAEKSDTFIMQSDNLSPLNSRESSDDVKKRDALKSKQLDNKYNQLLSQREADIPKNNTRQ